METARFLCLSQCILQTENKCVIRSQGKTRSQVNKGEQNHQNHLRNSHGRVIWSARLSFIVDHVSLYPMALGKYVRYGTVRQVRDGYSIIGI